MLLFLTRGVEAWGDEDAWKDEARRVDWDEDLASSVLLLRRDECSEVIDGEIANNELGVTRGELVENMEMSRSIVA